MGLLYFGVMVWLKTMLLLLWKCCASKGIL